MYSQSNLAPCNVPFSQTPKPTAQGLRQRLLAVPSARSAGLPPAPLRRQYGKVAVHLQDLRPEGGLELALQHPQRRLMILLEEVGGRAELRHDPRFAPPQARNALHSMSLLPASATVFLHAERMQYLRLLTITLPTPAQPAQRAHAPATCFFDPVLQRLAELLLTAMSDSEHLCGSLLEALQQRLEQIESRLHESAQSGALAAWQVRKVGELLQRQLETQVSLQTLADCVGLSRAHFCRAFRAAVGMPPHQWHLQMRVDRAKELMLARRLSLSAIALSVGFADQAHFSRVFRRTVGTTPGCWQRGHAA
jgi:AraC-like DNA-binding protein